MTNVDKMNKIKRGWLPVAVKHTPSMTIVDFENKNGAYCKKTSK